MPGPTLFRMDDFLLRVSAYLGIAVVLLGCIALSARAGGQLAFSGRLVAAYLGVALAPITMGLIGLQLRRREKRALALWRLIDREVEISSADLLRDSDWTRVQLERAVRDLNNSGIAYVVWDRSAHLLQDGRLRRSTFVVDECASCGGKISLQVRIGSPSAPKCPYCHDPIDFAVLAEEKARIIDELETDRSDESERRAAHASRPDSGKFSIVIFALLFAAFWPAALWYCARHRTQLAGLIR